MSASRTLFEDLALPDLLPELAWRAGLEEFAGELLEAEAAGPLDDLELLAVLRGVGEDGPWGRGVGPP